MILALFKMFGIFILIILVVFIVFILSIFNKLRGKGGSAAMFGNRGGRAAFGEKGARGGGKIEQCPSCHQPIMVGEHPGTCPKCGTPLGRSNEGKLLIRVN